MPSRFLRAFLWMALGAFGLLFALNLSGYGPAVVRYEKVRVVLPPSRQTQPVQPARRPVAPKPQVSAVAPVAPTPGPTDINVSVYVQYPPTAQAEPTRSTALAVPPAPPQAVYQLILNGHPQTYQNDWGVWLVDPNGGFHCPRMYNPTAFVGGMEVWVFQISHPQKGWYYTWAPACYR